MVCLWVMEVWKKKSDDVVRTSTNAAGFSNAEEDWFIYKHDVSRERF